MCVCVCGVVCLYGCGCEGMSACDHSSFNPLPLSPSRPSMHSSMMLWLSTSRLGGEIFDITDLGLLL